MTVLADRTKRLALAKKRAQDMNQWRNWTMENEGQEPAA